MTKSRTQSVWATLSGLRGANSEGILAIVLVLLIVGMSIANPAFFSVGTLFGIMRSTIVPLILSLGVLLIIISGGIDVSFAAIAITAAYTTVVVMNAGVFESSFAFALICALLIGAVLGLVNGFIIAKFKLPTLIVTLGTQGLFIGALMTFVGTRYIADLPEGMAKLSTVNLITLETDSGRASLHAMIIPAVILAAVLALVLSKTMWGRSIYAIGGDTEAARRAGIRVMRGQISVYVVVGIIAAFAGLIFIVMGRSASPQELVGGEMDIIAAVVLGGASIFGGRGSVLGTVIGVVLVQVINNSLILAGVPSAWQRAAVGVLLIIGVGIQAVAAKRAASSHKKVVIEETPLIGATQ